MSQGIRGTLSRECIFINVILLLLDESGVLLRIRNGILLIEGGG